MVLLAAMSVWIVAADHTVLSFLLRNDPAA
jgi:hypothetical protein